MLFTHIILIFQQSCVVVDNVWAEPLEPIIDESTKKDEHTLRHPAIVVLVDRSRTARAVEFVCFCSVIHSWLRIVALCN